MAFFNENKLLTTKNAAYWVVLARQAECKTEEMQNV